MPETQPQIQTSSKIPDPHVVLPAAVRKQARIAEEMSARAKDGPKPPEAPLGEANVKIEPVANPGAAVAKFDPSNPAPPAEPARVATTPISEVARTLPPPVEPARQPAPTPRVDQQQRSDDWEHKFNSVQGRYIQAEEQNKALARQLQDTQRILASLAVPQPQPQSQPQQGSDVRFPAPVPSQPYITEKDRKEFGDEFLDVVGRRAREFADPIAQRLAMLEQQNAELARRLGSVQNSTQYSAQERLYAELKAEVPDWEQVNNDPEFKRWVNQVDPLSGELRMNLLAAAMNTNQSARVVAAFKGFKASQATTSPADGAHPNSGNGAAPAYGTGPVATLNPGLAQYAAPSRAKPGQTEIPPEKPIIAVNDIPQFYRDKIAGKYTEAEALAIERQIFSAQNEGRLVRR